MKAQIHHINGVTFVGKSDSNHWIPMDGPEEFHGSAAGTRPIELVLLGLGGCAGSDIASILEKKRVPFDSFTIDVTGEQSDKHPKLFTSIHMEFLFTGVGIKEKDVERAIDLSLNNYCPVAAMLKPSVKITTSYTIKEQ